MRYLNSLFFSFFNKNDILYMENEVDLRILLLGTFIFNKLIKILKKNECIPSIQKIAYICSMFTSTNKKNTRVPRLRFRNTIR